MAKRKRSVGSVANELVKKAREAMLTAVQIYNNPQIDFKSELFIVTTVVAWTYLLHAYYRKLRVEYRQLNPKSKRPKFLKTRYGAQRHWSLEQCLDAPECPVDHLVRSNLMFLIGIRHEIEHQMTTRIDSQLSAKCMAAALNFNSAIKTLFDLKYGLENEQAFSIQFSTIDERTAKELVRQTDLPPHIRSFVAQFEAGMPQDDFDDPRYSYRIAFVKKTTQNKNTADQVVEFIASGSDAESEINSVILKETERKKYRPGSILKLMKEEGYQGFGMHQHTELWKEKDAKNPKKGYGSNVEGNWYWYESWVSVVREHCHTQSEQREPLLPKEPGAVRNPALQASVEAMGGVRIA
jgi:hypothetical protein